MSVLLGDEVKLVNGSINPCVESFCTADPAADDAVPASGAAATGCTGAGASTADATGDSGCCCCCCTG